MATATKESSLVDGWLPEFWSFLLVDLYYGHHPTETWTASWRQKITNLLIDSWSSPSKKPTYCNIFWQYPLQTQTALVRSVSSLSRFCPKFDNFVLSNSMCFFMFFSIHTMLVKPADCLVSLGLMWMVTLPYVWKLASQVDLYESGKNNIKNTATTIYYYVLLFCQFAGATTLWHSNEPGTRLAHDHAKAYWQLPQTRHEAQTCKSGCTTTKGYKIRPKLDHLGHLGKISGHLSKSFKLRAATISKFVETQLPLNCLGI